MATAPPSDHPATMILDAGKPSRPQVFQAHLCRLPATDFRRFAGAEAIADVIGDHHVQAEPAKAVEFLLGVGQAHGVAVEVKQGRPRHGVVKWASGRAERSAEEGGDLVCPRRCQRDELRSRGGMHRRLGCPLSGSAWKDHPVLQQVKYHEKPCQNQDQKSNAANYGAPKRERTLGGRLGVGTRYVSI